MKKLGLYIMVIAGVLIVLPATNALAIVATDTGASDQSTSQSATQTTPISTATTPAATGTTSTPTVTATQKAAAKDKIQAKIQEIQAQKQAIEQEKAALKEQKEALSAARCAAIEEKIKLNVARSQTNFQNRQVFHQKFINRLTNLITKLGAQGYDVTKLKADLVVLQGKIDQFTADKTAYLTILQDTKQYACGKSEGEFRAKLVDARAALNTARLAALDVESYYQTTVRPDLLALKTQKTATSATPATPATPATSTNQ